MSSHELQMASPVLVNDSEAKIEDGGKKEYSIVHLNFPNDFDLNKISIGHIYKQKLLSRFNFLKPYKIIRVEESRSIEKCEHVCLLTRDNIRSYRSKYKFLHVGLVQFSISSNILKSGFDEDPIPLSVSLRDSKYSKYEESILVHFNSGVCNGVRNFNWFPNFSSSLFDLGNSNGLVVTIDFSDCVHVKIRYRVCYKLMKKSLKPDYLFDNPVLEVDTEKVNVFVPKTNDQSETLLELLDC
ncbi:unnamed protein product [Trifolium pratense]|uniref:Uncharacterized protein n=1 Tax=Trifolium pratense TaxID=57577 RepID=A0ACB0LP28_TRIPR|nr:unnamed protein product [Trifolium pratense]